MTSAKLKAGAASAVRAGLLCVVVACAGCEETRAPGLDAGLDASPDAWPDAHQWPPFPDAGLPDARPDVQTDALVVQHHFCDQPFFKLPIDGNTEETFGITLDDSKVVWTSDARVNAGAQPRVINIHLLDLRTCVEEEVTQGMEASRVHIWGDHVVWDEFKDVKGPWCTDLYHLDLSTRIQDRLTQTPGCENDPRTNGRFVAYRWRDTLDGPPTVSTLRLLDMETGESTELWPSPVDSYDLDERHVVWCGYGPDPQSVGRDVYVYDLQTGETRHLDFTYDRYQWWVFLWRGWVTIQGTDYGLYDPINWLQLYNLETGELRDLVADDYATASAPIDSGLAVWNTSAYSGTQALLPADMQLYEIATGLSRRLTTQEARTAPGAISKPYVLIYSLLGHDPLMNDFYIANLEALGVLDASGNLVPGGPVITPP